MQEKNHFSTGNENRRRWMKWCLFKFLISQFDVSIFWEEIVNVMKEKEIERFHCEKGWKLFWDLARYQEGREGWINEKKHSVRD